MCLTLMTKYTFYSNYSFGLSRRFSHLLNWKNLHLNLSLTSTLNHVFEPRECKFTVKLQRRFHTFLLCDCFYRFRSCEDELKTTLQRRVSKSLTSDTWEKDQCKMSYNCYAKLRCGNTSGQQQPTECAVRLINGAPEVMEQLSKPAGKGNSSRFSRR